MSKIYGDPDVIKRAEKSSPGEKVAYVNWEAINELPDEFEATISEVRFNPKNLKHSFSNVGSDSKPSWMPNPDIMYDIAKCCGISGGDSSIAESMIEEVQNKIDNARDAIILLEQKIEMIDNLDNE